MATQAVYELAAAVDDPVAGRALWETAQRWQAGLASFSMVGLRAAWRAADRWGTPAEVAEIAGQLAAEQAQIVIRALQRVSTPGLRKYVGVTEVPRVRNGLGIAILSTSKGLMSDREARQARTGGELLALIW